MSGNNSLELSSGGASKQPHYMEYLRGNEKVPANLFKYGLYGSLGIAAFIWINEILAFVGKVVQLELLVAGAAALGLLLWGVWWLLSNDQVQHSIAMVVDRAIYNAHHALVARDKVGAAKFAIRQLKKRKKEADQARAGIESALQGVNDEANLAETAMNDAANGAKAMEQELKAIQTGGQRRTSFDPNDIIMNFDLAKKQLRMQHEFYVNAATWREILSKRAEALRLAAKATAAKITSRETQLDLALRNLAMAQKSHAAMVGYASVDDGSAASTLEDAFNQIVEETRDLNGSMQILIEQIEPGVRTFQLNQAAGQVADEEFYKTFFGGVTVSAEETNNVRALLEAPKVPVSDDISRLLGNDQATPVSVPAVKSAGTRRFDNLYQ